jgi:predicted transcriptional regulator
MLTPLRSSRTLKVMERKFGLKQYGCQLWTRETARPIRSRLGDILETMRDGDVLSIDASGVDIFDFSFASELFGKALSRLGADYPGRFVIAEGLTESAHENLNQALEASNQIMIERQGSELRLIGKVHQLDRETFTGILEAGEAVSASALGKKLDVSPTAMNERLSKLNSLGVIRREKSSSASGREQFVYKVMG